MSDSIRVMIYDKTALDDGFDIKIKNDQLTMSWVIGAKLYRAMRSVDIAHGVSSWEEALEWLATVEPGKTISQIQIWGHGWPGHAYIGAERIDRSITLPLHKHNRALARVRDRLTPESIVWFRSCAMFAAEPGHAFAKDFSNFMGCRIAAHTYIIWVFQGGLRTIVPGQEPYWPLDEGIEEGPLSWPKKLKWAKPWTKNTILAIRGTVPKGW